MSVKYHRDVMIESPNGLKFCVNISEGDDRCTVSKVRGPMGDDNAYTELMSAVQDWRDEHAPHLEKCKITGV